jgi:hypothetical protein
MKHSLPLLILALFLGACSTVDVRKAPEFSCNSSIQLSRVSSTGAADATGLTTSFTEGDREVLARLTCANLVNDHTVAWKWYQPDGGLYAGSDPLPLSVTKGAYVPSALMSHRMSISGDAAAAMEGSWEVRVYLDNSEIATKRFTLTKLPDLLELVRSYRPVAPDYRKYAIVIGIENYTETTPARFATRDAQVMQELFIRRFGVPEKNIISLVNEKATLGAIRNQLGNKLHGLPEDATLYVFYSGHGAPMPPKQGENHATPYIIPYDGNPTGLDQTGLSLQDFYGALDKLPAANIFVFMDSCFSGTTTGRYADGKRVLAMGLKAVEMYVKDPAIVSRKVVSFSSSQNDQLSNSSEKDKMGLFTSQFVRSLVSPESPLMARTNVSVTDLYDYLKQSVQSESLKTWGLSRKQTPTLRLSPLDVRSSISVITN